MLNKNISIWRGTQTPPTNYHLWEKEDGGLYVYVDEKWQHLIAPNDKTILDEHQQQLNKIKDLAITEVTPTNTNTYKSYQLKSGDNIFGTTIDIPKDKFIKQVTLGYGNATIDSSTGLIDIGTGVQKEYLLFSVILESGNYELVSISLTSFLTERDCADGLEVIDDKIKVKIDPDSEEYIDVSIAGLKVKGINNKISGTVDNIKNKIQNGEWLPVRKGSGNDSVIVGGTNTATNDYSYAEGDQTSSIGHACHAEGNHTSAAAYSSHAEGGYTEINCDYSHAEGYFTQFGDGFTKGVHVQGIANYHTSGNNIIHDVGIGTITWGDNGPIANRLSAEIILHTNTEQNGYKYLIGVGGYQGQAIKQGMKSVQEVFADLKNNKVDKIDMTTITNDEIDEMFT